MCAICKISTLGCHAQPLFSMSSPVPHPTPYPDVNAILLELLASVQEILGNQFVGMYLYGSLAAGDFDQDSDIDFLVVTADELSAEMISELQVMHARIGAMDSKWAMEFEGSYIPQSALRRHDQANSMHPHIDRGEAHLRVERHDSDWVIQRHILREKGVILKGPPLQTLIDPVSPNDLRRATLESLRQWWAPMLNDSAKLQNRGYQSYAVLTMCRMLYTVQHSAIVSKRVAARWVQETLDARWWPLIERAWVGRQNPQLQAEADDVRETIAFIRYTLDRENPAP